ncbi:MAG: hypothetical protein Q9188_002008 [Gyalolechia gomerana]
MSDSGDDFGGQRAQVASSDSGDGLGSISSRSRWSPTPESDDGSVKVNSEQETDEQETRDSDSDSDESSTATITDDRDRVSNFYVPAERANPPASSNRRGPAALSQKPKQEKPQAQGGPAVIRKKPNQEKPLAQGGPAPLSQKPKQEKPLAQGGPAPLSQKPKQEKPLAHGGPAAHSPKPKQGKLPAQGDRIGQKKALSTLHACITALGFREEKQYIGIRKGFMEDLHVHVKHREEQHLRRHSEPVLFDEMVSAFIEKHGNKYFGHTDRNHLKEIDPAKGNLWPRDAETE